MSSWYVVIGRRCHDDESTCSVLHAESVDSAIEAFKSDIAIEEGSRDWIFVDYVVACGPREPSIEMANV